MTANLELAKQRNISQENIEVINTLHTLLGLDNNEVPSDDH